MDKIVIKKQNPTPNRRAAVTVKPETYKKISDLSFETNVSIESIVETLLTEALKYVEVQ